MIIPVIARTTSLERLKSGEPMWEWNDNLPTMIGILPRTGDARDVRWFKGPARNTLHFLNAVDKGNTVTMELPVSDGERTPSQIKRWTFNLNSKDDGFGEDVLSTANGPLARMDDRFLSLPYKYCFVGSSDPSKAVDQQRAPGVRGRLTNTYQRVDVTGGKTGVYYVGAVQSLQESCIVPRKGSKGEGDGYLMGIASNYETMSSDLVIVDALRMEEGTVATVKLPFRLRGGTHTNWVSAADLPPVKRT